MTSRDLCQTLTTLVEPISMTLNSSSEMPKTSLASASRRTLEQGTRFREKGKEMNQGRKQREGKRKARTYGSSMGSVVNLQTPQCMPIAERDEAG
jgi:hypothetical protein